MEGKNLFVWFIVVEGKKPFFSFKWEFFFCLKTNITKQKMPATSKEVINMATRDKLKRTTTPKRPFASRLGIHGRCGLMCMLVFCFLVKETKKYKWIQSQASPSLNHQRFLFFSSCVGGIAPFRPRLPPPSIHLTERRMWCQDSYSWELGLATPGQVWWVGGGRSGGTRECLTVKAVLVGFGFWSLLLPSTRRGALRWPKNPSVQSPPTYPCSYQLLCMEHPCFWHFL